MSNRTQEPWRVGGPIGTIVSNADGDVIALAGEHARRIVACVNACKGISTETLERVDLPISAICLVSQCAEIGKQRDELLEAIKTVLALPEEQPGRIYRTPTREFREMQREAYQGLHAAIRKIDSTWGGV